MALVLIGELNNICYTCVLGFRTHSDILVFSLTSSCSCSMPTNKLNNFFSLHFQTFSVTLTHMFASPLIALAIIIRNFEQLKEDINRRLVQSSNSMISNTMPRHHQQHKEQSNTFDIHSIIIDFPHPHRVQHHLSLAWYLCREPFT